MKGNAVVVGSGFGGIASALRLRAMGYEVRVLRNYLKLEVEQESLRNLVTYSTQVQQ